MGEKPSFLLNFAIESKEEEEERNKYIISTNIVRKMCQFFVSFFICIHSVQQSSSQADSWKKGIIFMNLVVGDRLIV